MEADFLRILGAAILAGPTGNAPLDVGPSPEGFVILGLGALVILGGVVAGVILVSVFVIRRIKKRRGQQERS
jgi:hypothetical protein